MELREDSAHARVTVTSAALVSSIKCLPPGGQRRKKKKKSSHVNGACVVLTTTTMVEECGCFSQDRPLVPRGFLLRRRLPREEAVVFFFLSKALEDRVSDEETTVVRRARKLARSFIPSPAARDLCMCINKGG